MKRTRFALLMISLILVLGITAQEALSLEKTDGKETVFTAVDKCSLENTKVECVTHRVKKGEYLLLIAKNYDVSLKSILDLPQNQYLKERKIPTRLSAYFRDPWDLIYPKENITLPLIFAKDVKTAELEKKVGSLEQTLSKERESHNAEKGFLLTWAAAATFVAFILLITTLVFYAKTKGEVSTVP